VQSSGSGKGPRSWLAGQLLPTGSLGSQVSVVVVSVVGAIVVVVGAFVVVSIEVVVFRVVDVVVVAVAVTILRTESISRETSVKEAAICTCHLACGIIGLQLCQPG